MARKPRGAQPTSHADFAGSDADKENLEKIAAAAAAANASIGHNSGPSVEAIKRTGNAIEAALVEIEGAGRIMQKARAMLSAAEKTGKADLGSKGWVETVKAAIQLKRKADKSGMGPIVTEHRQMGTVLKALDIPLYTQFKLFDMPDEAPAAPGEAKPVSEADAYAMGEAAYKNGEPKENADTVGQPGSAQRVQFERGWDDAFDANKAGIGVQANDGGQSPGDDEPAVA